MKRVAIGCGVMLFSFFAFVIIVDSRCNPARYLPRLEVGMSDVEVIRQVPGRILGERLHALEGSRYVGAREEAELMGIAPEYLMTLEECMWPWASATTCYLYFDSERRLIGHYVSQS